MDNDSALSFVAGQGSSGANELATADSDFASWLVMSGDLLGSSRTAGMFDGMDDQHSYGQHQQQHQHHQSGAPPPPPPPPPPGQMPDDAYLQSLEPPMAAQRMPRGSSVADRKMPVGKRGSKRKSDENEAMQQPSPSPGPDSGRDTTADPVAKRQRRLEKNREIARNCRKRKREKYQKLEEEVVKLRQYNKQLEKQLNKGRDGRDREVARKQELTGMEKLLEAKCTEAEMKQPLAQYKEMYSDFGRERYAAIAFHMSQLKALLIPNTVSKMTLWSLQQDDEFYDEKKNQKTFGGGIWNMLSSELRFTDEQKKTLLSMRHGIRSQRRNVAECLRILGELETRVHGNFESMGKQMDMVMNTITPTQQAKFLLWIEKNKACTFMLNNMWKQNEDEVVSAAGTDDEFDDSASTMGMSEVSHSTRGSGHSGQPGPQPSPPSAQPSPAAEGASLRIKKEADAVDVTSSGSSAGEA